jgi:hypothetical protein
MSREILDKAKEILAKYMIPAGKHTEFQLRSIINGQYTDHGKMWQCVREINARMESIDAMNLQMEQSKDDIRLLKIEIERYKLGIVEPLRPHSYSATGSELIQKLATKEYKLKIRGIKRKIQSVRTSIETLKQRQSEAIQEIDYLSQLLDNLLKKKDWKGLEDNDAQWEYWNARYTNELHVRLLLGSPIDTELAKSILIQENDMSAKNELLRFINARNQKVEP